MLTFAHLWILWLAPLPLLVWWLAPPRVLHHPVVRVPFFDRLQAAGSKSPTSSSEGGVSLPLRILGWLLVLAALARPQWLEPPVERSLPTRDLLLLVDLSGSMGQEDFTNAAGESVDRLTAAKEVLGDFLLRRKGDRVGLVVFGNAPFLQVPFTNDLGLCQQLLDETSVGMAGPRTAFGDAIGLGIQCFQESLAPNKTIVALTDGNDTGSPVPPVEAARIAHDRQITIHTVAMGDPTTLGEEALDQQSLQAVAELTGGDYFLAMNHEDLVGIYDRLDQIETHEVKIVSHRPRRDLYFWPLGAALLVSLAAHLWTQRSVTRGLTQGVRPLRLRVNPRTFELETVER